MINLLSTVVCAVALWLDMEQGVNLKFLYKLGKSAGQTVNGEFNCDMLKRLLARIRHVWPHRSNLALFYCTIMHGHIPLRPGAH
ncbi:hypothetical protein AVEN_167113-1 [Araneus ventricosus]|uniref:Uncharacterized protein n=1 Tax=Araneus ventricosus TaxID=182803 RepID=A0A4Y2LNR3_ARAVE|nr:hypothetical protein AVEN_167113-1 [Araneus ventricosus]